MEQKNIHPLYEKIMVDIEETLVNNGLWHKDILKKIRRIFEKDTQNLASVSKKWKKH